MGHSNLFKKAIILIFAAGCLLASVRKALAVEKDVKLQISSTGEFFDVYLANYSEDVVSICPRISYSGVERNINLFFFKGKEWCSECALKLNVSAPLSVPPAKGVIALAPSELIGRRFNVSGVASSYSLKSGCYGVYATYREMRPPTGAFSGTLVSNAVRLCIP
jgi:hypothetical protein